MWEWFHIFSPLESSVITKGVTLGAATPILAATMLIRGRFGALLCVGWLCVAITACGTNEESTGQLRQRLSPAVSAAFDVEPYPELSPIQPGTSVLACGSERCLAAYGLSPYPLATRLNAAGAVLDTPRLRLTLGKNEPYPSAIGALGDEFLIQLSSSSVAASGETCHFDRIRGSDGKLLADVTQLLPTERVVKIVSTGKTWALVIRTGPLKRAVQLYDASFAPIGGRLDFPDLGDGDLIAGDGQYLATSFGEATRIDEATGTKIDATPIKYWSIYAPTHTRGTWLNGVYFLAAPIGQQLAVTRIADDGTPLDPDDDFNLLPGGHVVYDTAYPPLENVDFDRVGNELVVTFERNTREVSALRIDPATGTRQNGAATSPASSFVTVAGAQFSLEALGTSALLLDGLNAVAATNLVASNQVLSSIATKKPLSVQSRDRANPAVASNGEGYLVVFSRTDGAGGNDVLGARIDAKNGAFLDDPPLLIGRGVQPNVESNGTDYLVVWNDSSTTFAQRWVQHDGKMGAAKTSTALGGGWVNEPVHLAFNGKYFGLGILDRFARADASGVALDSPPLAIGLGGQAIVLADTAPTPDKRTFLIVHQTKPDTTADVRGYRVRSDSGALFSNPTSIAPGHNTPLGVSDGTNLLVVSHSGDTNVWDGAFVDAVSGLPSASPTFKLSLADNDDESVRAVGFDGRNFGVLTEAFDRDAATTSRTLRRYDAGLLPVDELEVTPASRLSGRLSVASSSKGCSLLVYSSFDLDRMGFAIKGQFVSDAPEAACGELVGTGGGGQAGNGGSSGGGVGGSGGANGGGGSASGGGPTAGGTTTNNAGKAGDADAGAGATSSSGGDDSSTQAGSGDGSMAASGDSNGCSCRVGVGSAPSSLPLAHVALLLALLHTRSRRARRALGS